MSFRGLNRQLTNHAVGGPHLCLVRDTKRQTEYSAGAKKYRQPNSQTEICRWFNISLYLITWEHSTPFARKRKQIKRHLPIVNLELEFLNVSTTCYYPLFGLFWVPMVFFCTSVEVGCLFGRGAKQKDKAPEPNRNGVWVLCRCSVALRFSAIVTAGLDGPPVDVHTSEPKGLRQFRGHQWKALGKENSNLLGPVL